MEYMEIMGNNEDLQRYKKCVEFLQSVMCFSSKDWSMDATDAIVYGVVVGWNEALPELARAFDWTEDNIERIKRYHREFLEMAKEK